MKIGVISDTHGLVRPEALRALEGVEQILHLGDVGKLAVLDAFGQIAPVTAVRGNVDVDGPCALLPATDVVLAGGQYIYMLHNLRELSLAPEAAKFACVLSGHTHRDEQYERRGVLYFNPGSCGPRRFELRPTVGLLTLDSDGRLTAQVIRLECD